MALKYYANRKLQIVVLLSDNMGRLSFTIHILTRAARICVLDFCPFLAFHFRFVSKVCKVTALKRKWKAKNGQKSSTQILAALVRICIRHIESSKSIGVLTDLDPLPGLLKRRSRVGVEDKQLLFVCFVLCTITTMRMNGIE
jgi:hypothetical protein